MTSPASEVAVVGIFKVVIAAILGLLSAAVAWIFKSHLAVREKLVIMDGRVQTLEDSRVTKEDVREVIKECLVEQEQLLSYKLKQAVSEGVMACQIRTQAERLRDIRFAVRELLAQDPPSHDSSEDIRPTGGQPRP